MWTRVNPCFMLWQNSSTFRKDSMQIIKQPTSPKTPDFQNVIKSFLTSVWNLRLSIRIKSELGTMVWKYMHLQILTQKWRNVLNYCWTLDKQLQSFLTHFLSDSFFRNDFQLHWESQPNLVKYHYQNQNNVFIIRF